MVLIDAAGPAPQEAHSSKAEGRARPGYHRRSQNQTKTVIILSGKEGRYPASIMANGVTAFRNMLQTLKLLERL